jgi:RNA-directed DNA polymerase
VLDGLEEAVHRAVPRRRSRINFIRYADDFIITAKSRTILEDAVKPVVEGFLAERGLCLSPEKTLVTHITDGFTFLGQTFRKHGRVLHITPSEQGVLALEQKVGTTIRKHVSAPMPVLIKELNQILRGWANYHRHVVASGAFSRIDNHVFERLWHMLQRRHPNKSANWLIQHYWSAAGLKRRVFAVKAKTSKGATKIYQLIRVTSIGIRRHVKIRAAANPYMPEDDDYFARRRHDKGSKMISDKRIRDLRIRADAMRK